MALKLVKRNKLPVQVKGSFIGEAGETIDFSFTLHCKRLKQDEIDAELKKDGVETVMMERRGRMNTFSL